ncbi:hypothetical protein I3760_06G050100 [Carya illinoinensis]|uniref:Uncharacterized protein n=1 Tax=Carya illinoinensis TaxID=32201 RepID=A0A8T1Q827_CARIL|nr:hypothetical protein I3760_06G050100 [Carya illinoinensis]KAG6650549.1 hypothetical protein CIPAW_06G051300 [Carya illinoinensis]
MEPQNSSSSSSNKENKSNEKSVDGDGFMGAPVHIQVIKIKKEIEIIKHPSLQQPEMRRVNVIRGFTWQPSPSPLGLADRQPISVIGNA